LDLLGQKTADRKGAHFFSSVITCVWVGVQIFFSPLFSFPFSPKRPHTRKKQVCFFSSERAVARRSSGAAAGQGNKNHQ
jgi:hypothetical protein